MYKSIISRLLLHDSHSFQFSPFSTRLGAIAHYAYMQRNELKQPSWNVIKFKREDLMRAKKQKNHGSVFERPTSLRSSQFNWVLDSKAGIGKYKKKSRRYPPNRLKQCFEPKSMKHRSLVGVLGPSWRRLQSSVLSEFGAIRNESWSIFKVSWKRFGDVLGGFGKKNLCPGSASVRIAPPS